MDVELIKYLIRSFWSVTFYFSISLFLVHNYVRNRISLEHFDIFPSLTRKHYKILLWQYVTFYLRYHNYLTMHVIIFTFINNNINFTRDRGFTLMTLIRTINNSLIVNTILSFYIDNMHWYLHELPCIMFINLLCIRTFYSFKYRNYYKSWFMHYISFSLQCGHLVRKIVRRSIQWHLKIKCMTTSCFVELTSKTSEC